MLVFAWILSTAHAEEGWSTTRVELLRWPDKTHVSARLNLGDHVEVLLHDGALVRVRKGTDFGWMPAAQLSATEVEPASAEFDPSSLFPGLDTTPMVPSPVPTTAPPLPGAPAPK